MTTEKILNKLKPVRESATGFPLVRFWRVAKVRGDVSELALPFYRISPSVANLALVKKFNQ